MIVNFDRYWAGHIKGLLQVESLEESFSENFVCKLPSEGVKE